jgi:hypothetical protein
MPEKQRRRPWDRARDFHHAKRFVFAGAGCGVPGLVRRLSRGRGRMVCNVAVPAMERSAARLSHPRVNPSGSDLVAQPDAEL